MFIFHCSTYTPSMTYSLPVTTIGVKTLNQIQWRAIQAIVLHKLGVSKAFPRRVAFGPKDLCGLALLDMSVEQGVRGIQHFTNHLFLRDSVGNLILLALRSLQIESGSDFHLLEHPSEWVPYIAKCWLTCIQEFLARNKITLKVASAKLVRKSRQHDCHIMDVVHKLEMYNHEQLFDINAVWMHLQITTLSDIADANGWKITDKAFKGQKLSDRYSRLKWPQQLIITSKQRNIRGCFYFFWYRSEATIRGMDWASDSSLEKLLQSSDQMYCNLDAWIDALIYGIHSTSRNTTPCGCYSNCYCINVCVPWGGWLEHYGTSKRDDDSNLKRDCDFPFAWWELSRGTWWC
jgi:hypothetical protein